MNPLPSRRPDRISLREWPRRRDFNPRSPDRQSGVHCRLDRAGKREMGCLAGLEPASSGITTRRLVHFDLRHMHAPGLEPGTSAFGEQRSSSRAPRAVGPTTRYPQVATPLDGSASRSSDQFDSRCQRVCRPPLAIASGGSASQDQLGTIPGTFHAPKGKSRP